MGCNGSNEHVENTINDLPLDNKEPLILSKNTVTVKLNLEKCPNNHSLFVSKTNKLKCSSCGEYSTSFYTCSECKYKSCNRCYRPKFKKKPCSTVQELIWRRHNVNNKCTVCNRTGLSGYYRKEDNYFICSNKCKKIENANICPNGHSLEWRKVVPKKICEVCKRKDEQVLECRKCEFVVCCYCTRGKYSASVNKLRVIKKFNNLLLKYPRFNMYKACLPLTHKKNGLSKSQVMKNKSVLRSTSNLKVNQSLLKDLKPTRNPTKLTLRQIKGPQLISKSRNIMTLDVTGESRNTQANQVRNQEST